MNQDNLLTRACRRGADLAARPLKALRGRLAAGRPGVCYLSEGVWVIQRVGEHILEGLEAGQPGYPARIVTDPRFLHGQVVHFGSLWSFASLVERTPADNRLVVTVFHGHPELDPKFDQALAQLNRHLPRLDRVVTACDIMVERLASWGVPPAKLVKVPLGVCRRRFAPRSPAERQTLRVKLGLPPGARIIGSFQKDGEGWDEGLTPKRIKGPDLLVETLGRVAREAEIFVLLTGPARGYVKAGLTRLGVPFLHRFLDDYADVADYYNCLDLYLVTSREEGGPEALPESMACGVPVVTTPVGMAPEMIEPGVNGLLARAEDPADLARQVLRLFQEPELAGQLAAGGLATVARYDWRVLAREYRELVYAPLLAEMGKS